MGVLLLLAIKVGVLFNHAFYADLVHRLSFSLHVFFIRSIAVVRHLSRYIQIEVGLVQTKKTP